MTERQRILMETTAVSDKAESLLRGLQEAKARSDKFLADSKQVDQLRLVTGRSSMDNAIVSAQRMVETLNRALEGFKNSITDEDIAAAYEPETVGRERN
jgi:hypothetical protein